MNSVNIVLLGGRWAGKSSCGNTILNEELFTVGKQIEVCAMKKAEVAGMQVTVVDTPSWYWVSAEDSSDELLLVYPLGSPFVKRHQTAFQEHLELLGADVWDCAMVLFSRGDCLGEVTIEQHLDNATEELKWLVEKCSHRYHVLNNKNRSDLTQVTELLETINQMFAGRRRKSKEHNPPFMAEEVGEASGAQGETK